MIKTLLKKIVPDSLISWRRDRILKKEYEQWIKSGRPDPVHTIAKQKELLKYAAKYKTSVLIETGTYLGGTIDALKKDFRKLISIEISHELHQRAKIKFRKFSHIELFQGDSGEIMPSILRKINEPCLFWLDGHYSGDITGKGNLNTPIFKELDAVYASRKDHVILIDDARLFVGKEDYPTLHELESYIKKIHPAAKMAIETDIIRIVN